MRPRACWTPDCVPTFTTPLTERTTAESFLKLLPRVLLSCIRRRDHAECLCPMETTGGAHVACTELVFFEIKLNNMMREYIRGNDGSVS